MDVTLPSGKVIRGVPKGTSKTEIMRKAVEAGLAKYEDFADKSDPMLDPTRGFASNALAGAGKAFVDLGRGVRDIGYDLGMGSAEGKAASDAAIAESRKLDAPLMGTGGGLTGNILGSVAATLPTVAIPGINTASGAGLLGGALGALQPTIADESRAMNAAIGGGAGAAGQGAANAVGRMIRPVQTQLPAPAAALAQKAEQAGIGLNAAQQTGSRPLKIIDSVLDQLPFTADKQAAAKAGQRAAWQRGLLALTGENADEATPTVLGAVKERVGAEFERLASAYDLPVDDALLNKLATVESKYAKRLPTNQRAIVQSYIDDLTSADKIPGAIYQDTRSMLTKQIDGLRANDPYTAGVLREVRDAIDDRMTAHIKDAATPADAKAWTAARKQWKMLKRIEKATDAATGDISPKKLFNEMNRKDKAAMLYGAGDQEAADLARIGKEFIAEQIPNSGTAQRQMYQNLLTGGGGALGVGGLLGVVPPAALGAAAVGAATPMAMQRALWSGAGKKYLTKGLLKGGNRATKELMRGMLRGGGAALPLSIGASQ